MKLAKALIRITSLVKLSKAAFNPVGLKQRTEKQSDWENVLSVHAALRIKSPC